MNRNAVISRPDDCRAMQIDQVVEAFEAERSLGSGVHVADFLPDPEDDHYFDVLCELVRVDLEWSWRQGSRKPVENYLREFAAMANSPAAIEQIALEEHRVRTQLGEQSQPEEYERRLKISTSHWPPFVRASASSDNGAMAAFPAIGATFLGFELLEELGRGRFGRVYLARQSDLAQRLVALKVTTAASSESDTLALLQHTNIVPIHSVHRSGKLQAVCMPFFGRTTLADALGRIRSQATLPDTAEALLSTVSPTHQERRANKFATESALPRSLFQQGVFEDANTTAEPAPPTAKEIGYVEGCLRIARDIAAGLAHAHAHGLVHRDLKPANILLAADGRPMILDFGLAQARLSSNQDVDEVGGTLPYMAPEQLRAVLEGGAVTPAADIYSLGVLLFELLTSQVPFPSRHGPFQSALTQMVADRRQTPPSLRQAQPLVPRAVESIVRKCLEPDVDQRYTSAEQLAEDVRRQLADEPLRYAVDTSWRERLGKWARRHPRLTSGTSILTAATAVIVVLAALWMARGQRIAHLEAIARADTLHARMPSLRTELTVREMTTDRLEAAQDHVEQALADFVDPVQTDWKAKGSFVRLDENQRQQVSRDAGEAYYLLAQAALRRARVLPDEQAQVALRSRAAEWSNQAAMAFGADGKPRAVQRQQQRIRRFTEQPLGEERGEVDSNPHGDDSSSDGPPTDDPLDRFLTAITWVGQHEYAKALPILREQCGRTPQDFSTWLLLGQCLHALGEVVEAEGVFSFCTALNPRSDAPYYRRGLCRLDLKKHAAALDDFSEALRLRPDEYHALFNRGLAHVGRNEWRAAQDDFTAAIRLGAPHTRIYLERARVRDRLGDAEGAAADRREGLARVPSDDASWVARGFARLPSSPRDAAVDFLEALRLNPHSTLALANLAYVQAEHLAQPEAAVQSLDRLIALRPSQADARASRGVLLARLGRRQPALDDARAVLAGRSDARTTYKVACIFALTSKLKAADTDPALRVLADALRRDTSLAKLATSDPDWGTLRTNPRFQALVSACAVLQPEHRTANTSDH